MKLFENNSCLIFGFYLPTILLSILIYYTSLELFKKKINIENDQVIGKNSLIEPVELHKSNRFKTSNESICDPYIKNLNIFSVTIDNVIYPKFTPLHNNPKINYSCLNTDSSSKLILLWTQWFDNPSFVYGIGYKKPFEINKCPVTNCEITNDRSRLNESNMIVFHMRDPVYEFPSYRTSNQRWVFYLHESPIYSSDYETLNNLFNLSATYRRDSNFTSQYFYPYHIWAKNELFDENRDFSFNKTEFAAIIVSNCYSRSGRLHYINELKKYIPLTVFGKCGEKCHSQNDDGSWRSTDCHKIISKKYKFYFAFENSLCTDYVTEKFFKILPEDIIPVVYGNGSYSSYVPKSGFINAFDFQTTKHLAEYLIYLDKNKTAYNSYFKWKRYVKFISSPGWSNFPLCEMCIRLNLEIYEGVQSNIIKDMNKFWNLDSDCIIPSNKLK